MKYFTVWSIRTQLYMAVTFMFIATFVTSLYVNISNTRDYIQEQLDSHAQDTATSLGLSISPYMSLEEDKIVVDTMISAIFDRGYYQSVVLKDVEDNTITEKTFAVYLDDVPEWFVSLFPITPPIKQTEINDGWQMAGVLQLQSHPGLAYHQLWNTSQQTFTSYSVLFLICLGLGVLLARGILKPLSNIQQQALAICNREFITIDKTPKAIEVKSVVSAMNKMVGYIKQNFDEMSDYAEKMRKEAYEDPLTGLGNRRSFDSAFKLRLEKVKNFRSGFLFVLRLDSLKIINDRLGHEAADSYIIIIKDIVNKHLSKYVEVGAYRTQGSEIGFFITDIPVLEAKDLAKTMTASFAAVENRIATEGIATLGFTEFFEGNSSYSELFEQIDTALALAKLGGFNQWHMYEQTEEKEQHNFSEWQQILDNVISTPNVKLMAQPIASLKESDAYKTEITSRFIDNSGHTYNMRQLVAIAERSQLTWELDKIILGQVLELTEFETNELGSLGVKISPSAIHTQEFIAWLKEKEPALKKFGSNLTLVISEFSAAHDTASTIVFITLAHEIGLKVCIEKFGASFSSFKYLNDLKCDFIKIDGSYIKDISESANNQFFVKSLVHIAHGIGIPVIAEFVESDADKQVCEDLAIDAVQGYLIGKPQKI